MKIEYSKQKVSTAVVLLMFSGLQLNAQSGNVSAVDFFMNIGLISGIALLLIAGVIFVLRNAYLALHENGQELNITFPLLNKMTNNSTLVAVLFLLLLVIGLIFAINN